MSENNCIKIWSWYDAPKNLKSLSRHGGDEDWIIFCPYSVRHLRYLPASLSGAIDGWETSYSEGWGHIDRHEMENGDIVVIFAHA